MDTVLPILVAIAVAAVLLTLLTGVVVMTRGGEANQRFGNKLMRLRIVLQLIAVMLFVMMILSRRG
ncbi:MAG: twin transmembrane helix small protein [Alphaproteobacteria bacterium]